MIVTQVTAPVIEPVSLSDAKLHCRVDTDDDDVYMASLISVARKHVEDITNRVLITQTWDWFFDQFPYSSSVALDIPFPPLQSITHVKYTDTNGVEQTWGASNYDVDTDSRVGRVYPVYNGEWPTDARKHPKACTIRFVAGYADSNASPQDLADNVPKNLKQAIMLLVGELYEVREMTVTGTIVSRMPIGFNSLLANYRIYSF